MCLVVDIGCGCVCVWVSFLNIHWLYAQVDEMVMQTVLRRTALVQEAQPCSTTPAS